MRVKRILVLVLAAGAALALSATAFAHGGNVVFDGGTAAEQANVRAALDASAFDWNVLPKPVTVHIGSFPDGGDAAPGNVSVDAALLDSGRFAWGVVQHEFGHEVDFMLLGDAERAQLLKALGGATWWYADDSTLAHARYGCERFASTLAWAYWPTADNSMAPAQIAGESGGMAPAAFRALLAGMLGTAAAGSPPSQTVARTLAAPRRSVTSLKRSPHAATQLHS